MVSRIATNVTEGRKVWAIDKHSEMHRNSLNAIYKSLHILVICFSYFWNLPQLEQNNKTKWIAVNENK